MSGVQDQIDTARAAYFAEHDSLLTARWGEIGHDKTVLAVKFWGGDPSPDSDDYRQAADEQRVEWLAVEMGEVAERWVSEVEPELRAELEAVEATAGSPRVDRNARDDRVDALRRQAARSALDTLGLSGRYTEDMVDDIVTDLVSLVEGGHFHLVHGVVTLDAAGVAHLVRKHTTANDESGLR